MIYEPGDLPTVESGIQGITETDRDTRQYVNVALIVSSTGKVFRREISNITVTYTCLSASSFIRKYSYAGVCCTFNFFVKFSTFI